MKRLVDESTDELTRSLLVAGIEHRPPPGNRRRVMLALGASGAFGLFSSNAFAWLGTTAGKVTAASVVVGIAGAALVIVPQMEKDVSPASNDGRGSHATVQLRPPSEPSPGQHGAASSASPPLDSAASDSAASDGAASDDEEAATRAPGQELRAAAAPTASRDGNGMHVADASGQDAKGLAQGRAANGESASLAKGASKARARASKSGGRGAASKPSVAARRDQVTVAQNTSAAASEVGGVGLFAAGHPDLDAEVRLVDDMHWAVRRNDDEALARFLERYRLTFPDGQLKKEVAEFAARLSPSAKPE